MKAQDLGDVVNYFDHREPPSGSKLDLWYVERSDTPRTRMREFLRARNRPTKELFAGPRGSGKTTELNQLTRDLAKDYYTFNLFIGELNLRYDINHIDLMRSMATQVLKTAIEDELLPTPLSQSFEETLEPLHRWWRDRVAGLEFTTVTVEGGLKFKLGKLLDEIEASVKISGSSRKEINDQIDLRMTELIRYLNLAINEVARRSGRKVMIIVEQTDKLPESAAIDIFMRNTPTIVAPHATMIFTFPNSLRFSEHFNNIMLGSSGFDRCRVFPNLALRNRKGIANLTSVDLARQIILKRLEPHLIAPEALESIIEMSDGNMTSLVFLVSNAAENALSRGAKSAPINRGDAQYAVSQLRRTLAPQLTSEDYELLRWCHANRPTLTQRDDLKSLLYKGALLEYMVEDPDEDGAGEDLMWGDAHPALWSLLK